MELGSSTKPSAEAEHADQWVSDVDQCDGLLEDPLDVRAVDPLDVRAVMVRASPTFYGRMTTGNLTLRFVSLATFVAMCTGAWHVLSTHVETQGMTGSAIARAQGKQLVGRSCLDLPGAELKGSGRLTYKGNLTTHAECRDRCRDTLECRQSVFSTEDGAKCDLFGEISEEPERFVDYVNSSYCGANADEKRLLQKVKKVFKMKPWVPENPHCSWAGDNCMQSKCCANTCKANWAFTTCEWFSCYAKDDYFASCHLGGAPFNWNGTKLGGHAPMDVGKAPKGVLTQGTKLFCFCLVMWGSAPTMQGMEGEGTVANNFKKLGRSIMQCDDHVFVDGSSMQTGSVHNIDPFIKAWKQVKEDGRWKRNDWTVKVDADAVFFPDRLRWHIEALRPPQGSVVYLRNTDFKFHFLGALEVLSREAVATYFERGWECETHLTKEGGEDYWMLQCLEGIGVNYISDYRLLNDKYAAEENCNDDWAVAFHFYKKSADWNWCHDAAVNAWKAKQPTTSTSSPDSQTARFLENKG